MKFLVVIEKGPASFGAYVPDLPGCVAVAKTRREVKRLIRDAIQFHVEDMRNRGYPIPKPSAQANSWNFNRPRKSWLGGASSWQMFHPAR